MDVPTKKVKFNRQNKPEFFKELNKRVNKHFKDNNISKHANLNMMFKTLFMVCLYFVPLILMLTNVVTNPWAVMSLWVLMGLGMSGIGLSIMHDANHGSYSKNKNVNLTLGYIVNFIGGYHVNWKIQHNVLHHSFTNIHEHDEDISGKGLLRLSPAQERKPHFKFQAFYAPLIYSIMTVYWCTAKDFIQLARYRKKDLLNAAGHTYTSALSQLIFNKIWYMGLVLVLPLLLIPLPWFQIVAGFLVMHFICGLVLALIFQPAHVIEETSFFTPEQDGSVENHWAIHQMKTTANFANKSSVFSWLIGGLNFQIEHHLFPHICHVHYKKLSKIVKETAQEFNVPYYEHETFAGAVKSHFSLLHRLGTGTYDKTTGRPKVEKAPAYADV